MGTEREPLPGADRPRPLDGRDHPALVARELREQEIETLALGDMIADRLAGNPAWRVFALDQQTRAACEEETRASRRQGQVRNPDRTRLAPIQPGLISGSSMSAATSASSSGDTIVT